MSIQNDIILLREANLINTATLFQEFGKQFPSGVCLSLSAIYEMINKVYTDVASGDEYMDVVIVSIALVKDLLQTNYSPIVIIGPFSVKMMELFVSKFASVNVFTVSLFYNSKTILQGLNKAKIKDKYTYQNTSDSLTRYKKRRIKNRGIQFERKINTHINKTINETNMFIDITLLDCYSVAEIIIENVKNQNNNLFQQKTQNI